mmetsp:Transcript_66906/g.139443  ORF Transcript_66906/g.139443 Transcript_66906/m.139443 type:complete len:331 (+) Transcript_66906:224-1216(+)
MLDMLASMEGSAEVAPAGAAGVQLGASRLQRRSDFQEMFNVGLGGVGPAVLVCHRHRVLPHPGDLCLASPELDSALDVLNDHVHVLGLDVIRVELVVHHKARLAVADGVSKASRGSDNGDRRETHALHLHQPAGLIAGRHQREVCRSVALVLLLALEGEDGLEVVGELLLHLRSHHFKLLNTAAHRDELGIDARVQSLLHRHKQHVDALLRVKATHEDKHRDLLRHLEAQRLLHHALADGLELQRVDVVHRLQPHLLVHRSDSVLHSVQDALDVLDKLHHLSALGLVRAHFLSVSGRDSEDRVGSHARAVHQVQHFHRRVRNLFCLLEAL